VGGGAGWDVHFKPVDAGENLVVLILDDGGVFYRAESGKNLVLK